MLTMIGAVAAFERELLLERQAEGIAQAKAKGKYLGRKPTAQSKKVEIKRMNNIGISKKTLQKSLI